MKTKHPKKHLREPSNKKTIDVLREAYAMEYEGKDA